MLKKTKYGYLDGKVETTRRQKINLSHHHTGELSHSVPNPICRRDDSYQPTKNSHLLTHFPPL